MERKLVTVRPISALLPIPGADAIETAVIDGWTVVVKKGEFQVNDLCVYFEIDSFLPDGNPAWQFLVDKQSQEFEGVRGHRLRTIRLRKQLSQGLALPLSAFPQIKDSVPKSFDVKPGAIHQVYGEYLSDTDFAPLLDVKKWEATLPAQLAGQAEGLFPSFIVKTDQERCQNLCRQIFGYDPQVVPVDSSNIPQDEIDRLLSTGEFVKNEDGSISKLLPAQASRNDRYEVTIKLDGSSMTVFNDGGYYVNEDGTDHVGVCSRNLELKDNEENAQNAFVKMFNESGLKDALKKTGLAVAVQGELMGPNIQGNRENLKVHQFFVFNIQALAPDVQQFLPPLQRLAVLEKLYDAGVSRELVMHAPILFSNTTLEALGIEDIQSLLDFANGPSLNNPVREGLVFKRHDGLFSFKAISNHYLLQEK
jgi:hypothetical protein